MPAATPYPIALCGKRSSDSPDGYRRVDVTSHAKGVFRELSPFYAGPVQLYGGKSARNVENAWQYAKVYARHLDENGDPSSDYFAWAGEGWSDPVAHRRPMGRTVPKYSYWDGKKLDYVEARKRIYVPLYARAVSRTDGYAELKRMYLSGEKLCLLDYDAYDAGNATMDEILDDATRPLGHSFVLKWLLEGALPEPEWFRVIIAGGRRFDDYETTCRFADSVLRSKAPETIEIVSGAAAGADLMGMRYAKERGYPVKVFPADWVKFGKRAGFIRNEQMGRYADALIAFWDGISSGTQNMIEFMQEHNKPVRVKRYKM